MAGGANTGALITSQRNFENFGAVERGLVPFVRPPRPDEPIHRGWRMIDLRRDDFEPLDEPRTDSTLSTETVWPSDRTVLYYWRPTFWRARTRP